MSSEITYDGDGNNVLGGGQSNGIYVGQGEGHRQCQGHLGGEKGDNIDCIIYSQHHSVENGLELDQHIDKNGGQGHQSVLGGQGDRVDLRGRGHMDDAACGCGSCKPACMQGCARPRAYLAAISALVLTQSMLVSGYTASIVTTIEQRYGLRSSQVSFKKKNIYIRPKKN